MHKRRTLFLFVLIITTIVASYSVGCSKLEKDTVILQREWFANAEFAGDVCARRLASKHGLQLEVREGGEMVDPIKAVRSGDAHFGVASADRVLGENEAGAGLVILAAATFPSPVVFLSKRDSGITDASHFRNHTVGIQAGTNTELILDAVLMAENLTRRDMTVVESGWGTANFENGSLDVLGAFAYDEPVRLAMKGIAVNEIKPEKSGVHYIGTVYFTRAQLIRDQPELVQKFMSALYAGWKQALLNHKAAIELVKQDFPKIDGAKELQSLKRGDPYFRGEGEYLLYASSESWGAMAAGLIRLKKIRQFSFEDSINYQFLQNAAVQTPVTQ